MSEFFQDPSLFRSACRKGEFTSNTSGQCEGYVQANVVIMPKSFAKQFTSFCQDESNRKYPTKKACPVLEVVHGPYLRKYASNSDIRTDLPSYIIWKNGKEWKTVTDIRKYWQEDFVTILIGCSFSFEQALQQNGIAVKNVLLKKNVSMYETNIVCPQHGSFHTNMIVSMRPIHKDKVNLAYDITSHFEDTHGQPIHHGNPEAIGIKNIHEPEYGDAVPIEDDEVPVFWACGITSQLALKNGAKDVIVISHAPGHMFVTDKKCPIIKLNRKENFIFEM